MNKNPLSAMGKPYYLSMPKMEGEATPSSFRLLPLDRRQVGLEVYSKNKHRTCGKLVRTCATNRDWIINWIEWRDRMSERESERANQRSNSRSRSISLGWARVSRQRYHTFIQLATTQDIMRRDNNLVNHVYVKNKRTKSSIVLDIVVVVVIAIGHGIFE